MGTVHKIIEAHGRRGALSMDIDRRVVDAAADFMADEEGGIGFLFSGWAQAALPHKRLPDDAPWQVQTERVMLLVQPGRRAVRDSAPVPIGVPYGSRARLIMLYLQTEAIRTNSREVELGKSLRSWLAKMDIAWGGKTVKDVREQAERISHCSLSFQINQGGRGALLNQHIVDTALFLDSDDGAQGSLFLEKAKLSESFFEQLKRHPVPLQEAAIRRLNASSMALDIYCWLAYRLHVLEKPCPITWLALKAQFGTGFNRLDHFRATFQQNLELAMAVYPEAKVVASPAGLTLHPSRPAVPPKLAAVR
ncbi:plasmid replication initiator [Roseomonas sp. SSH11]|uniref:Plasmid replication initiator n=2 Tax=Pararoseomonas baculiformis TaxID=2820812 RepID=A0ABS4AL80_9PROT|nr:plasmid replication initiator [Pararoseomonas baculiformis]